MNKKGKKEAPAKELVATLPQRTPRSRRSQKSQPSQQNPQKSQMPKEELKRERKEHKHEAHLRAHKAHEVGAAGNVMDDLSKKQAYKKFAYRGLDITKLISLTPDEVAQNLRSRQ